MPGSGRLAGSVGADSRVPRYLPERPVVPSRLASVFTRASRLAGALRTGVPAATAPQIATAWKAPPSDEVSLTTRTPQPSDPTGPFWTTVALTSGLSLWGAQPPL